MNATIETTTRWPDSLRRVVRPRLRDMAKLSARRWARRYLWESERHLCPPMAQNGFNEWNYWHLVGRNGGIVPTCPELLIRDAWRHRKSRRLKRPNAEVSEAADKKR